MIYLRDYENPSIFGSSLQYLIYRINCYSLIIPKIKKEKKQKRKHVTLTENDTQLVGSHF